jgi:arginyl-tRNA synthetase
VGSAGKTTAYQNSQEGAQSFVILQDFRRQLENVWAPWAQQQGLESLPPFMLEEPPAGIEADLACNIALLLAKSLKKQPRALAQELQALLLKSEGWKEDITIAGAGFLNFRWNDERLHQELRAIHAQPQQYGRAEGLAAKNILIEFVSANPTGPLHVGHGRGAALGDSLALILSHLGHHVTREYYINDAGSQVLHLGESVLARALEIEGKPFVMPEDGYHGDYIRDVARDFLKKIPGGSGDLKQATSFALKQLQEKINQDLADFGVHFDSWFSEASVVNKGLVDRHVQQLKKRGFIEEYEEAVWFVAPGEISTPSPTEEEEVRDKNRVLKRRDGRWTYFATDIAYHADKFDRGYNQLIDIWGADHHGYVARVQGSMQALGYDPAQLHIVLYQLVSLLRGGTPVSMSKRSGDFVTLREVLDEVGKDACRFFFALRGPNTALEFDLELAKKHSNDNPVFYLQYAHARICSIFRQSASTSLPQPITPPGDLSILKEREERDLMKRLALFPQALLVCASEDSPHPLANYLLLLCRQFHHFYDHHRVLGEDAALTQARLFLLNAVKDILKLGLQLLGVSAPEEM